MFGWLKRKPPPLVEHVEVKPDDVFVIHYEGVLRPEQREAIASAVERFRKGETKFLVLECGLRITVFSKP